MFDDRPEMARDRQRLLGLVDSAVLGLQVVPLLELLIELIRQQRLVYPPMHEADVSGSQRQCWAIPALTDQLRGVPGCAVDRALDLGSLLHFPISHWYKGNY